jgi:hypothetical protein
MGVVKACSPVARRIGKLFFGYKKPAITAFELFVIDLVTAGFPEICELLMHEITSIASQTSCNGDRMLSTPDAARVHFDCFAHCCGGSV